MAVYVGNSEKLKITLGDLACYINFFSSIPITNGIRLLSSEDYVLKDSNGLYLTTKESE